MTDFAARRTMLDVAAKWEEMAKSVDPSSKAS